MFNCVLRLKEACDLKISNIYDDTIKVLGKGQKERLVYLPPETKEALMDYLKVRTPEKNLEDRDYVFTTASWKKLSYNYFTKICHEISIMAGVKWHPHMVRHTYATELFKSGVNIYYVARLLGH
ncbi:integrase / recombinase [Thermoplasma volcanium GSS1]|uniref:Integrase / recombinase n=1 Tax=Thermoplasma volcanium (strain ATCC 51530 / DSM 4299 / JCM 9571 / NBRC 15438 / GSS1) TaxID=273116 RepID=Q97AS3_THEVO|nr:site-specific integrase [Thermoplasma volcanium]BAB59878.1 integrase / recombinase [Thermoplasma volcanium GSS1]